MAESSWADSVQVLTYRRIHGMARTYLADELIQPADLGIRAHLRLALTTSLPVCRTRLSTVDDRAFPVATAHTWNDLQCHVTSASSLPVFRSCLKTHLFRRSFSLTYVRCLRCDSLSLLTFWSFIFLFGCPQILVCHRTAMVSVTLRRCQNTATPSAWRALTVISCECRITWCSMTRPVLTGPASQKLKYFFQVRRSGLAVALLPAAREGLGSNRAADKSFCVFTQITTIRSFGHVLHTYCSA